MNAEELRPQGYGDPRGHFPPVSYGQPLGLVQTPSPPREEQLRAAHTIFDRVRELYAELEA